MYTKNETAHRRLAWSVRLLLLGLACGSAHASPAGENDFIAVDTGANSLSRWPARVDTRGTQAYGQLRLGGGVHLALAAGHEDADWRFDAQYQHGGVNIDSLWFRSVSQTVNASGHYDLVMANGYRKLALSKTLGLFAGLGAGWGRVVLPKLIVGNGCTCFSAASDNGWAYQGRLGAEYMLAENQAAYLQYTRISLPGPSSAGSPSVHYSRRAVDALSVGYRYLFK